MKKKREKFVAVLVTLGIVAVSNIFSLSLNASAKANKEYNVKNGMLMSYEGDSEVYIRDNVSAVAPSAFDDDNVTKFIVDSNNKYFKTVDGVLYTKDGKRLVRYPSGRKGSFTVPNTATYIAQYAFKGCGKLTSINIPSSVRGIGANAFYECKKLESVSLPSGINKIAEYTFDKCRSLKNIVLPDGVKNIGSAAFYGCTSLSDIKLPSSLKKIEDFAFSRCRSLKNISIPEDVSIIERSTFSKCTSLENVTFNNNIEKIRSNAFEYCTSLMEVSIPDSVDDIETYAFQKCEHLKKVVLPEGIEAINYGTFKGCTYLNTLKLPESIRYIYGDAFKDCVVLDTVNIPANTEVIKESSFENSVTKFIVDGDNRKFSSKGGVLYNKQQTVLLRCPCYKWGSYTTPDTVKKISQYAFKKCQLLKDITISEGVKIFPKNCLTNSSVQTLSLPESLREITSAYNMINTIDLGTVTIPETNPEFCLVDGLLYSKDKKDLYIYPNAKRGTVTFPKEAQNLSAIECFNGASEFEIPESSKNFATDDGIITNLKRSKLLFVPAAKTSYTLGSSIKNIDAIKNAKQYMYNFKGYKVSKGNQNYKASDGILYNINGNKLIDYPATKGGSYSIPSQVTSISNDAFAYSRSLRNITVTKNVVKCNLILFDCISIENIVVKEGALRKFILNVYGDTELRQVTLPSSLVSCDINGKKSCYSRLIVNGWTNTVSEKLAVKLGVKFNSMGLVPNKVKRVKVRAYVHGKRVRITWKRDSQASGYEIYTDTERLKDIKNNQVNKSDIYVGSSSYNVLYIRAYKIQNGKKMYGKAKKIVYTNY